MFKPSCVSWPRVAGMVTACLALGGGALRAQGVPARAAAPVIDSITITTYDIFTPKEAERSGLFRLTNALHVTTNENVVRRELLFHVGDVYDSARVAESARNLRALGIFRRVAIDTARVNDRLVVHVVTADAWSTQLDLSANSTGGEFTWALGVTEQNFAGTANLVGLDYRQEVDRSAFTVSTLVRRAFDTHLVVGGFYDDLSDGRQIGWNAGLPYLALSDRVSLTFDGSAAHRRVLQFRDTLLTDSGVYRRTAVVQGAALSFAPVASTAGYVRVGVLGQVRHEEYVLTTDTLGAIPDSVYGAAGLFGEVYRTHFKVVRHYNGFAQDEDVDLSTRLRVEAWVAPSGLGYTRSGFAPVAEFQTGASFGAQFVKLQARAHAMFTSAGVDSSTVWGALTFASQALPRQATVLHVEGGVQKGTPPGTEFDLGHVVGPRGFKTHAFTGTREVWGTLEHRAFLWDQLLGVIGFGVAGFVDYGGAWYADEPSRLGGDVGFGLRIGSSRSSGTNVGRIDFAYRFGDGVGTKRWVVSLGRSFEF